MPESMESIENFYHEKFGTQDAYNVAVKRC